MEGTKYFLSLPIRSRFGAAQPQMQQLCERGFEGRRLVFIIARVVLIQLVLILFHCQRL
jgi:hypothetical protein